LPSYLTGKPVLKHQQPELASLYKALKDFLPPHALPLPVNVMLAKGANMTALEAESFCPCTDASSYCLTSAELNPYEFIPNPADQTIKWNLSVGCLPLSTHWELQ